MGLVLAERVGHRGGRNAARQQGVSKMGAEGRERASAQAEQGRWEGRIRRIAMGIAHVTLKRSGGAAAGRDIRMAGLLGSDSNVWFGGSGGMSSPGKLPWRPLMMRQSVSSTCQLPHPLGCKHASQ